MENIFAHFYAHIDDQRLLNCVLSPLPHLFARLLVLSEQMVEDSTILLVDPLHLVDVLGHLLHANQRLNQVLVFVRVWISQVL